MRYWIVYLGVFLLVLPGCRLASKDDALIAVATNFAVAAEELEADFETSSSYQITLSAGATGQLYAQIIQGAPFDVFLSADQARPERLEAEGQAVAGSRFTFALGQIALWAPGRAPVSMETLNGGYRYLAMANPELAPYGRAASAALDKVYGLERDKSKIVYGENVGQAYGLVATGNADLGIVALSSLQGKPREDYWHIPHAPIAQDAVLLNRARDNEAAKAFLAYLKSPQASDILLSYGYLKP